MIDYHMHTPLCRHARGSMIQYIEAAVAKGLSEICFLEHLTLHRGGSHLSMTPGDLPLYLNAVRGLAHRYRDRIDIKAGLEIDYDPENAGRIAAIIAPLAFDVIGASVHFIYDINLVSSRQTEARENADMDFICESYLEHLEAMLQCDWFDMICHIDVVKKFGRRATIRFFEKLDAILDIISYKNIVVELNTSGFNHPAKESYPDAALVEKCRQKGIPMTLGSDAHRPDSVGQHFDKAIKLLQASGYHHLTGFHRRRRYQIPIDPIALSFDKPQFRRQCDRL